MKQFWTVFRFELMHYFKNKGYIVTSVLIAIVLAIGLSIPSIMSFSKNIIGEGGGADKDEQSITHLVIYDPNGVIVDRQRFEESFEKTEWRFVESREEATSLVDGTEITAGFVMESLTNYIYLVQNTSFTDDITGQFNDVLEKLYREEAIEEKGVSFEAVDAIYNTVIEHEVVVLGKDSVKNYVYTYILIFILYFLIMFYGQLIAVSITSEKSNRAIEVLVTSTSSNSLIFGKVLAGAVAGALQVAVILGVGFISYGVNKVAWDGLLDFIFEIPFSVVMAFAVFGMIGYLLYAFIYGALGAMVSKTEDISSSSAPVLLVFIGAFMVVMFGMTNSDSILMKVASFVPFSSSMAMVARVAMGSVSTWEILLSFLILLATTGGVGIVAAKIYRMGTLRYGNPIKLKDALKWMKK